MGQTLVFWAERSDAESIILYSQPIDVSSMDSGTVFLNILGVGTVTASLVCEESIDPSNPNSWTRRRRSWSGRPDRRCG